MKLEVYSLKYELKISKESFSDELNRLMNQVYKLLPYREEDRDWEAPLSSILVELKGINELTLLEYDKNIFLICSKLEGLRKLTKKEDYENFRSTIFKCLTLLRELKDSYEGY